MTSNPGMAIEFLLLFCHTRIPHPSGFKALQRTDRAAELTVRPNQESQRPDKNGARMKEGDFL
jgi:hypothetical protein